jgi:hypothetical protein
MNSSDGVERRRYSRIKRQIPLKIKLDDYDLVGQTYDISCIGTYCRIDRSIPLFSIISIIILLPLKTNNRKSTCNVRCQGVVVRTEENTQNNRQYNVAIYFNRLTKPDKAKLSQYVQQYL